MENETLINDLYLKIINQTIRDIRNSLYVSNICENHLSEFKYHFNSLDTLKKENFTKISKSFKSKSNETIENQNRKKTTLKFNKFKKLITIVKEKLIKYSKYHQKVNPKIPNKNTTVWQNIPQFFYDNYDSFNAESELNQATNKKSNLAIESLHPIEMEKEISKKTLIERAINEKKRNSPMIADEMKESTIHDKTEIILHLIKELSVLISKKSKSDEENAKQLPSMPAVQDSFHEFENNSAITISASPVCCQQNLKNETLNFEIMKELRFLKNELNDMKRQTFDLFSTNLQPAKDDILSTNELATNSNERKSIQHKENSKIQEINSKNKHFSMSTLNEQTMNLSQIDSYNLESDQDEISNSILDTQEENIELQKSVYNNERNNFEITSEQCQAYKCVDYRKRNFKREYVQSIIKHLDESFEQLPISKDLSSLRAENPDHTDSNIRIETSEHFNLEDRKPHIPIHPSHINICDIVRFTRDGNRICLGLVRFIGELPNQKGIFLGLELDKCDGLNDGLYHGKRYFKCENNKGLFVSFQRVMMIFKHSF